MLFETTRSRVDDGYYVAAEWKGDQGWSRGPSSLLSETEPAVSSPLSSSSSLHVTK